MGKFVKVYQIEMYFYLPFRIFSTDSRGGNHIPHPIYHLVTPDLQSGDLAISSTISIIFSEHPI